MRGDAQFVTALRKQVFMQGMQPARDLGRPILDGESDGQDLSRADPSSRLFHVGANLQVLRRRSPRRLLHSLRRSVTLTLTGTPMMLCVAYFTDVETSSTTVPDRRRCAGSCALPTEC